MEPVRFRLIPLVVALLAGGARVDGATPVIARVTSTALGEVREFTVHLPAGYAREPRRRYAVVYVLDGPPLDAHTAEGATMVATAGDGAPLIVVGIPNMRRGDRARDFLPPALSFARPDAAAFTGAADRFLAFLRGELIPRIERDYRTTRQRLLVGHSLGAIFVCYSLAAAPTLFDARFAHSPAIWRDEDLVVQQFADAVRGARAAGSFFYLSVGALEGDGLGHLYDKLHVVLARQGDAAGLRWRAAVTPEAVHESNVRLATAPGLRAWFAGKTQRPRPPR